MDSTSSGTSEETQIDFHLLLALRALVKSTPVNVNGCTSCVLNQGRGGGSGVGWGSWIPYDRQNNGVKLT